MSRESGNKSEDRAVEYLRQNGFKIETRNFHSRFGEIDIIATRDNTLHFIEVKARSTNLFGKPAESVTSKKLQKIITTAKHYPTGNRPFQFDVIVIEKSRISLLENITF